MKTKKQPSRFSWVSLFAIVLMGVGFVFAYQFVQPAPPRNFTIATGSEGGAYFAFAEEFRDHLATNGIELEIRPSAGSIENLESLTDPESEISVAFVQSGLGQSDPPPGILSLGSLYYEPVWVFYRNPEPIDLLGELQGKRIATGPEGSGTQALSTQLLEEAGVSGTNSTRLSLGSEEASHALRSGDLDAAFFIASAESELVSELLTANGIRLMHFRRAEAYARRLPSLSRVTLPEGVIDPARGIPERDVSLLAPTATLLCREDFHPALIDLLLQAATAVHGSKGLFEDSGQFPSSNSVDYPLSSDARRYFEHGPPFLQRFLPFWAATLIDRLKIMLLPLFFLLLPFAKILPPLYKWKVRSRIYRWYEQLQEVDEKLHAETSRSPSSLVALDSEIEGIEKEVRKVEVPLSYGQELYALKLHLALVRDKIEDRRQKAQNPSRPSEGDKGRDAWHEDLPSD